MAFDQNSIPTGLRPLNVARTLVEDPRITPVATTGRNPECFIPNHPRDIASADSVPVPYKGNVSDVGFVELGYGNMVTGVAPWCPRMPPPLAHPATIPAVGLGYCSNLNVRGDCGGANAIELASGCMTVGINQSPNLSHQVGGGGMEFVSNNISMGSGDSTNSCNRVAVDGDQISSNSTSGFSSHLGNSVGGSASDQVSEEGGDGSISRKKVKFLCSFGGKIFPRPSDGMLRYVGGQTRIISVRRDVTFNKFVQKMVDTCGQAVVIKYQLPDEDLDALVSVSCPDDLDNMMDEYEKLVERSSDGSAKLRMFLFFASELDSSGMVQLGDLHDSGQRYVETVNEVFDGVGGRITRKESFASATSTQNSDLSGTEAIDISNNDLGVVSGPPSTTLSSPGENLGTSVAIGPGLVKVDPVTAVFVDAPAVPSSIPVVNSVPPEASSQTEAELGRSVPVTLMQQQPGIDFPPPVSQLQPTVDLRQAPCVDYIQFHPQLGFSNPHHLRTSGSMFMQQPNTVGTTPHQFVPAVHMTMAPSSSHPIIMPNTYQSLAQYPQSQMEYFANPSAFGPRFVQVSAEQGYNSRQVPAPPVSVGGGFGINQVPWSDQTVISDELVSHRQVTFSEKIERLDDCYFCQTAVPHAHSNSLLQDQRENLTNPISDSKFSYYSHHPEDHSTAQPMKNTTEIGALGQQIIEQGVGMQTRIFNPMDAEVGKPSVEAIGFSHHIEGQHENDNTLKDQCNLDHSRISALRDALGRQGDIQLPHVAAVEQIPQSSQVDTLQQHHAAVENQFHPNPDVDKQDIRLGGSPILASKYNIHENPQEYSNSHRGIIPNQNATHTGIWYDHLRPIVGDLETLNICQTDICANFDSCKSPIERSRKEDNFDSCSQPVSEREVLLGDNFVKPKVVLNTNHVKPTTFACSSSEIPYLLNERPVESSEVAQLPVRGSPGTLPQSENGVQHLEYTEVCHSRNPQLFDMKTEHINNKVPVSAEWKEDSSLFESRMLSGDVESVSLPSRAGNVQDTVNSLFSNQDPWNLQHDAHFLPSKPNKIQPGNEAVITREPLNVGEVNMEALLDDGVCHPLVNSNKGSSEEQIRKDLQAVAEGVAAAVLQSAQSSNYDLHERSDSCETSAEGDIQNNNDVTARHSEKANFGFPMSEGFGHLQVIKNSDLEELRELGSGTFGTVYYGKWRGTDVAIKRVNDRCFAGKPSEQDRMREDFWNEAIKLADLHHPNVVAFYGVVFDGPGGSVATVTEFMVNGSLRNALLKNEKSLDKRKCLLIAMDVAFGMEYLHRKNIVHFDLKSDNLLVNLRDPHRPICKVGDLGLSKVKRQTLISGGVRGTLPWMAPELLNGSSNMVSEKVDVFSFGIVLWELLTGEEPYANLRYGAIIGGIVSNTLRPEVPESCDPEWRSLMERCWSSEPSERPSFTEIAQELRSMAARVPHKVPNQPQ